MAFPGAQYRHDQQYQQYQQPQQSWGPPSGPPPQQSWAMPGSVNNNYGPPSQPPPGNYGYQQGSMGYAPQYAPPAAPQAAPHQYGQQNDYNAPPQYQNMPVHYKPEPQGQYQGQGQQPQMYFKYSDLSGKRKALLIGINYVGSSQALKGCHNDALNMQKFLQGNYNFQSADTVLLLDSPNSSARQIPTRENIIAAMQWLVRDAQPNDNLFFHYSGHGGQAADTNGDEDDGYDEVIYPVDHQRAGHIVDDIIHDILVKPLPAGCRLTAIFDSCHSASALDLPYIYSTQGKIKEPNLLAEAGSGAMKAATSYMRGDIMGAVGALGSFAKQAMNGNKAETLSKQTKTSPADVISWSGCKDDQTSADTSEAGKATGAMSYAFISALSQYPQQTYIQLLNSIRDILQGKYSQKPQLSASHPMDMNLLFIL